MEDKNEKKDIKWLEVPAGPSDKSQEVSKKDIIKSLEPMFKEAEEKGLWFNSKYQDVWLSPSELREKQAEGKFIWGKGNWVLRDPKDLIETYERGIEVRKQEIEKIKERINKEN